MSCATFWQSISHTKQQLFYLHREANGIGDSYRILLIMYIYMIFCRENINSVTFVDIYWALASVSSAKVLVPFNGSDVLMNSNTLLPIVHIQSNPLKRTRSEHCQRKFNTSLAPPLPQIQSGDLILQVFTHKSLRRPNATPEQYGDNERLADLGKVVLDAAITHTLFHSRPILQAAEISVG